MQKLNFFNSMIPLSMQNPLSRITAKDLLKIGLNIHNNNPTVFPRLRYIGSGLCLGGILTFHKFQDPIEHLTSKTNHVVLVPNGHGFHGTNIQPGQVYLFVQTLMDSSKQFAHPGMKFHSYSCSNRLTFVSLPKSDPCMLEFVTSVENTL